MNEIAKCSECINGTVQISENGYSYSCCLPQHKAAQCLCGQKDYFMKFPFQKGENDEKIMEYEAMINALKAVNDCTCDQPCFKIELLCEDAAYTIQRLVAENERLKAQVVDCGKCGHMNSDLTKCEFCSHSYDSHFEPKEGTE